MKKFGLNEAKEKFVYPIKEIFQRETHGLDAVADRTRCWNAITRSLFQSHSTPRPFAGKWPTRVLIFKASEDWERIYCYYFGKRTGRFRIREVLDFSQRQVLWLEFDKENYVRIVDFRSLLSVANALLMREYYYRDRSTRSGDLSRYGILNLQGRSDPQGAYYYVPNFNSSRLYSVEGPSLSSADLTAAEMQAAQDYADETAGQ